MRFITIFSSMDFLIGIFVTEGNSDNCLNNGGEGGI